MRSKARRNSVEGARKRKRERKRDRESERERERERERKKRQKDKHVASIHKHLNAFAIVYNICTCVCKHWQASTNIYKKEKTQNKQKKNNT